MDIRERQEGTQKFKATVSIPADQQELSDEVLNESLLFNILKKIESREIMTSKYAEQKEMQNKDYLTKYFIHGNLPLYYIASIIAFKSFRVGRAINGKGSISKVVTIPNFLFHGCVTISLNEYIKYTKIFEVSPELSEEYQKYRRNVDSLIAMKMQRFQLWKKILDSGWCDEARLMEVLKRRVAF